MRFVCACLHKHIYVCTYVCVHIYTYIYVYINMYAICRFLCLWLTCPHTYIYACMCAWIQYIDIYVCVFGYICVHMYIYMYIYICTYCTHIYMYIYFILIYCYACICVYTYACTYVHTGCTLNYRPPLVQDFGSFVFQSWSSVCQWMKASGCLRVMTFQKAVVIPSFSHTQEFYLYTHMSSIAKPRGESFFQYTPVLLHTPLFFSYSLSHGSCQTFTVLTEYGGAEVSADEKAAYECVKDHWGEEGKDAALDWKSHVCVPKAHSGDLGVLIASRVFCKL